MNLIDIFKRFPDQESCIAHLEEQRWGDTPVCPLCGSIKVARKRENQLVGRWNCHDCHSSFNVLSKTIFQKTKVPLQKWFLAFALLSNAKKSVSSHQLARDLELTQPTAWYMAQRIRRAMADDMYTYMLGGTVEADETYVGGRPRKGNNPKSTGKSKRGRGTDKMPVVGAVERGGRVIAEPTVNVDRATINQFITAHVTPSSTLITDQFVSYGDMRLFVKDHLMVDHSVTYVDGEKHTNTIENFWSLLKRAWLGTHHQYSRKWAIAYIVEACFKYNMRKAPDTFERLLGIAIGAERW